MDVDGYLSLYNALLWVSSVNHLIQELAEQALLINSHYLQWLLVSLFGLSYEVHYFPSKKLKHFHFDVPTISNNCIGIQSGIKYADALSVWSNKSVPVSRFEFTDELSLQIGQWPICLAVKTARQIIVNQSENGYGWDNYTDC